MACCRDPLTNVCATANGHVRHTCVCVCVWGGGGCSPRPEERERTSWWSDPGRQAEKGCVTELMMLSEGVLVC